MRARRGPPCKAPDGKQPSKKLRCEKRRLARLAIRGSNVCGSSSSGGSSVPLLKESSDIISGGNWCLAFSPVFTMMLQSEGKGMAKMSDEMQADQANLCVELSAPGANSCFPKAGGDALFQSRIQEVEEEEEEEEEEGEEGSCGAEFSDSSEMEPEELPSRGFEMDNSAFLNEDSNQPLPVDRFFGSVAFMQDLPAAPLARATASRREFRKLHFIAKDDEDESEDVA